MRNEQAESIETGSVVRIGKWAARTTAPLDADGYFQVRYIERAGFPDPDQYGPSTVSASRVAELLEEPHG